MLKRVDAVLRFSCYQAEAFVPCSDSEQNAIPPTPTSVRICYKHFHHHDEWLAEVSEFLALTFRRLERSE
jgi:hypothetical protein